jgi:hypothetical protein
MMLPHTMLEGCAWPTLNRTANIEVFWWPPPHLREQWWHAGVAMTKMSKSVAMFPRGCRAAEMSELGAGDCYSESVNETLLEVSYVCR